MNFLIDHQNGVSMAINKYVRGAINPLKLTASIASYFSFRVVFILLLLGRHKNKTVKFFLTFRSLWWFENVYYLFLLFGVIIIIHTIIKGFYDIGFSYSWSTNFHVGFDEIRR